MDFSYEYSHNYPINSNVSDAAVTAILSIYLLVLMVAFIFWIIQYIFRGVGIYTIAKRIGRKNPWMAFVPFARTYLHGELAGTIPLKTKSIRNPGVWKLVAPIIANVVGMVFYFILVAVMGVGALSVAISSGAYGPGYDASLGSGTILAMVVVCLIVLILAILYSGFYMVLCILIDFQIFGRFTSRNMAIVHAILSAAIPLYETFCLFVMRNREFNPGMEPRLTPPPAAPMPPVPPTTPPHAPVPPEGAATPPHAPVTPVTSAPPSDSDILRPVSEEHTEE